MMAWEGDVGGSVKMRVSALVIEILLSAVQEGISLN
jgi:hypothetical protein